MPRKLLLPNGKQVEIVIDPGHGGKDPGAVHPDEATREIDICHPAAYLLSVLLKLYGFKVHITPAFYSSPAVKYSLKSRTDFANATDSQLFVSVHANASASHTAEGSEVFYYKSGKELASKVAPALAVLPSRDRGAKQANFYVLRKTSAVAILLELGFVDDNDNDDFDDREWLLSHWPLQMAAVSVSIREYVSEVFVKLSVNIKNSHGKVVEAITQTEAKALKTVYGDKVKSDESDALIIEDDATLEKVLYSLDDMRSVID